MLKRNKHLLLGTVYAFALLLTYYVGYQQGHDTLLRSFIKQYKASEIEVGYGRYIGYRNISINIENKNYSAAKCESDLAASSLYDVLLSCLSDIDCSKQFNKEEEYKIAPELFDKKPNGFKYYSIKDGVRSCGN